MKTKPIWTLSMRPRRASLLRLVCVVAAGIFVLALGSDAIAKPLKHLDGSNQDTGFPDEWPDQTSDHKSTFRIVIYQYEFLCLGFSCRWHGTHDPYRSVLRQPRKSMYERHAA